MTANRKSKLAAHTAAAAAGTKYTTALRGQSKSDPFSFIAWARGNDTLNSELVHWIAAHPEFPAFRDFNDIIGFIDTTTDARPDLEGWLDDAWDYYEGWLFHEGTFAAWMAADLYDPTPGHETQSHRLRHDLDFPKTADYATARAYVEEKTPDLLDEFNSMWSSWVIAGLSEVELPAGLYFDSFYDVIPISGEFPILPDSTHYRQERGTAVHIADADAVDRLRPGLYTAWFFVPEGVDCSQWENAFDALCVTETSGSTAAEDPDLTDRPLLYIRVRS